MNEWQLARYIIDAKKCVDSLLYINTNIKKKCNLEVREIVESKLRLFYINLCVVFDHSFSKSQLKILKGTDEMIRKIYYERDKNYAHKDIDYFKEENIEFNAIIVKLKKELEYCYNKCSDSLPKSITLDYVSYDKNLFRFIHQITPELENRIESVFYKNEIKDEVIGYKIFDDTEIIKNIKNNNEYAVIIKNGLILKEGLQNRQDFCIKINVLFGLNSWCQLKDFKIKKIEDNENEFITFLEELKSI